MVAVHGFDFLHFLVVMHKPDDNPTRDDTIDSFITTLAVAIGR